MGAYRYRTGVAAEAAGMSVRQVSYLAKQDVVCPQVRSASFGSSALYSFRNIVELQLIVQFRALQNLRDVPTVRLRPLVDALADAPASSWEGVVLFSDPARSWVLSDDEAAGQVARLRSGTFVIPLGVCELLARQGLRRLRQPVPSRLDEFAAA